MNRFISALLTAAMLLASAAAGVSAQDITSKRNYIRVDQFGYLPDAKKVAVIADAVDGFNSAYGINLNANVDVTLRRNSDNAVVKSARATVWNGGATDGIAGDKGWWFDFSDVTAEGTYYLQVTENGGNNVTSNRFRIADDVYAPVLKRAMQMFYYQRSDFNKTAAYAAGGNWIDGPWYDGADQDRNARYLHDGSVRKDMRGGWIDAGDPNKYVNFAAPVVHNLLTTYRQHPDFWDGFTLDIPESGNGVADLLDEIKYEMDWVRRMQRSDGGVYTKVGILNDYKFYSPPSSDTRPRYFDQVCANSTIVAAGMLAHAASVYRQAGAFASDVSDFTARAERAWDFYQASPNKGEDCDNGEIEAGDADGVGNHYSIEHKAEAVVAAMYLFDVTGKSKYNDFVKANYTELRPWNTYGEWSIYRSHQGEAALNYAQLDNADGATRQAILDKKTATENSTGQHYTVQANANLYRAKAYYLNWGSNSLMSREGYHAYDFVNYGLKSGSHAAYEERANAIVNYMHGVNPFGMVYLTNMYGDGAEFCADEIYHTWFYHGTEFDNIDGGKVGPPPGFLQGGANPVNTPYLTMKIGTREFDANTTQQPAQKAFSVSNEGRSKPGGGYEAPYAFNEPAIYYQASYVKMLANFVADRVDPATPEPPAELVDDVVASSQPGQVTVGATVDVVVDYAAAGDRDVLVYFETDGSPWTRFAQGRKSVSAGAGTVTVSVAIPADLAPGTDIYKWQTVLTTRGGDWGQKLDNLARTDVDALAPAPPAEPEPNTSTVDIYAEGFANDWVNWSWGGNATTRDGLANSGSYAFKYDFDAGGGAVSFQHPDGVNGEGLVALKFSARTWSTDRTFDVSGSYNDDLGSAGPATRITVTPTYQTFTISAAQLGGYGWYKRFFLRDGGSESIFIDDVRLLYDDGTVDGRSGAGFTEGDAVGSILASPNPTRGQLKLEFAFNRTPAGELDVELYSPTGRLVHRQRQGFDAMRGAVQIDVHGLGLPSGLYVARLVERDGPRALTTRFVVE